jgi:hypothetical protein
MNGRRFVVALLFQVERKAMLKLCIRPESGMEGHSRLEVFRESENAVSHIATYSAEGCVPGIERCLTHHRIILNDTFNLEDVALFGRYGILEFSSGEQEHAVTREILYISGGKREEVETSGRPLLRLSKDDHRHLMFLLRSNSQVIVELNGGDTGLPAVEDINHDEARVWQRLSQIAAQTVAVASPFFFSSVAAAQCSVPSAGQNGSVTGANYTGIEGNVIQHQEGGVAKPTTSTGLTLFGLDLGAQNMSSLQNTFQLPDSMVQQLAPYVGLKGVSATAALNNHPLNTDNLSSMQQTIYANVYPVYFSAAAASFNMLAQSKGSNFTFAQMNVQWQTVFASMYFQAAPPNATINDKFMRTQFASQMVNQQWSAALQNLSNFQSPSSPQNIRALDNYKFLTKTGCTTGAQ